MSSGKDHAPHPTIRSIDGEAIHEELRGRSANEITAEFYPRAMDIKCNSFGIIVEHPRPKIADKPSPIRNLEDPDPARLSRTSKVAV